MAPKNNWNSYEKYVVAKLERHDILLDGIAKQNQEGNDRLSEVKGDIVGIKVAIANIQCDKKIIDGHTKDIGDLQVNEAQLQVKSGAWGALAGIVTTAIVILGVLLKTDFSILIHSIFG